MRSFHFIGITDDWGFCLLNFPVDLSTGTTAAKSLDLGGVSKLIYGLITMVLLLMLVLPRIQQALFFGGGRRLSSPGRLQPRCEFSCLPPFFALTRWLPRFVCWVPWAPVIGQNSTAFWGDGLRISPWNRWLRTKMPRRRLRFAFDACVMECCCP